MINLETTAPAGHSAEFAERDTALDELRTLAILDNYLGIHPKNLDDYASGPAEEAFPWTKVHADILSEYDLPADTTLDVFAFYSRPNPNRDAKALNQADLGAYFDSRRVKPGDFLYYYREGIVDTNGNAMVFCVWTDRKHASVLRDSQAHDHAAAYADSAYHEASTQWLRIGRAGNEEEVTIKKGNRHSLPLSHSKLE